MKSCKEAGNKLLQSFSQAGKSAAASWKKFVQTCQKVCTGYGTSQVQCVEKVCANAQKMKKMEKRKIVRMCREIRVMLVQMYRKL